MGALDAKQQAAFAGWQGAFFNAARFFITGVILKVAGQLEGSMGAANAWSTVFAGLALLVLLLAAYNARMLPGALNTEHSEMTVAGVRRLLKDADRLLQQARHLARRGLHRAFRFAEGQVQTIGPLFLLEARDKGGLGLTTSQVADVYGWVGTGAFFCSARCWAATSPVGSASSARCRC